MAVYYVDKLLPTWVRITYEVPEGVNNVTNLLLDNKFKQLNHEILENTVTFSQPLSIVIYDSDWKCIAYNDLSSN